MENSDRISVLRAKHAELEARLERETGRPLPDDIVIHDIKREKLAIKDELARIAPG